VPLHLYCAVATAGSTSKACWLSRAWSSTPLPSTAQSVKVQCAYSRLRRCSSSWAPSAGRPRRRPAQRGVGVPSSRLPPPIQRSADLVGRYRHRGPAPARIQLLLLHGFAPAQPRARPSTTRGESRVPRIDTHSSPLRQLSCTDCWPDPVSGKRTAKILPRPSRLSTAIAPPCSCTIRRSPARTAGPPSVPTAC
jgi:hypothetical protein